MGIISLFVLAGIIMTFLYNYDETSMIDKVAPIIILVASICFFLGLITTWIFYIQKNIPKEVCDV